MYVVALPETKMERRGRVPGHGYVKLSRDGEKYLNEIAGKIGALNISVVVAADIHAKPGEYLARLLNIPFRPDSRLRGFNYGRFSGHETSDVRETVEDMFVKWDRDETIPIVGGDSWVSYHRRFLKEMNSISQDEQEMVVLATPSDIHTWKATLIMGGSPYRSLCVEDPLIKRGKVYRVKKNVTSKSSGSVQRDPSRSSDIPGAIQLPDGDVGITQAATGIADPAYRS